jgi:hypothetical protein
MWQTTERSNIALDKNSQAMNRQSDQADLDAGRITKQEYLDKWFPNKNKKFKEKGLSIEI